jgi:hypothetical protein
LWQAKAAGAWLAFVNDDLSIYWRVYFSIDDRYLAWGSQSGTITVVDLPALQRAIAAFEADVYLDK